MRLSRWFSWCIVWSFVLGVSMAGCSGPEGSGGPEPAAGNPTVRFLRQPFEGDFLNGAPFDHDLPLVFQEHSNSYMLTWWGGRIEGIWNGHNGHDWLLPDDTPVLAAAAGEVVYADFEPPFVCPGVGETSALVVRLRHVAPNGELFETLYAHLHRLEVTAGQRVRAGQVIGLSGQTGCVNGPHLHFGVIRLTKTNNGRPVAVDPFGWQGPGPEPWALHPDGAASLWLWESGQAPDGGERLYRMP